MKKLILFLCIAITACSPEVDETIAKQKTSELIDLIKNHKYEETKDYYSDSFNASESTELRAKKFEQIESASGAIKSFELISSEKNVVDERNILVLKYKVICERLTLTHNFIVAKEEGEHVVLNHQISNL